MNRATWPYLIIIIVLFGPNSALGQVSTAAEDYEDRGLERLKNGDLDGAIRSFTMAIEITGGDAKDYYNRGIAWLRRGDSDHAMTDFDKAIRIDPLFADAYSNRGILRGQKGYLTASIR